MTDKRKINTEPLWYKDAVIYELHVKSFYDSNDDGIGDFQGLIQKLDYIQDLGVTAIWLLPFYPSPQRDDGYDIADYFNVHKNYGTLGDFKKFLREAHKRGIRVITELVINHTSDQHKWFQRARNAKKGSAWRNYYVWSDTPEKYKEARVIFQDFEHSNWTWDQKAEAYYWHRFYSHQPDLNFDNPQVQKQIFRVLDFWLGMGVDGLRLDAIPYLFQREETNCENLPETHQFLKKLRAHVDSKYENKMLLAEANQWPEDAAEYFGEGDECHMAFHFPVMPRLFMALQMEDRFPVINMIEQSMDIPENCQWTMFLRNHDELTLEMVTDEERDYMYKAYAKDPKARINLGIRRRLGPLLENNRRKIELMYFLLFSLPGTPVLYYGDEIGMGDNYYLGDRDGVRTPMQWSSDRNAGFSKANPQQLYLPVIIDLQHHYTAVNVENQIHNSSSLLWFMKRLTGIRNRFKAFGRGSVEFIDSDNPSVLSFIRKYDDEYVLVVANLSRFCQVAYLNLAEYANFVPEEVFGANKFPVITDQPYVLTLGPHNTFWFILQQQQESVVSITEQIPRIKFDTLWENITRGNSGYKLARLLPDYLRKCRWFSGKGKSIRSIKIADSIIIAGGNTYSHILMLETNFVGSGKETYLLPLSFETRQQALDIVRQQPECLIAEAEINGEEGIIYDGVYDKQLRDTLLETILSKRNNKKNTTGLVGSRSKKLRRKYRGKKVSMDSKVIKGEQSNTSILYEDTYFFKLYRRLESGINPDAELSKYLTEYTDFSNFPAYAGSLEWKKKNSESMDMGLLMEYVPNESDGWTYTLDSVSRYLIQAAAQKDKISELEELPKSISDIDPENIPDIFTDLINPIYLDMVSLLGQRTAELHLSLASLTVNDDTKPEAFSLLYQKSVHQSMRALTMRVFNELKSSLSKLDDESSEEVKSVLDNREDILKRFRRLTDHKVSAMKIRIHGDYHLGQVLYTGKDFDIIDFEGEPARPLSERRLKRSALRDVAGMIRSFHYAAHGAVILKPSMQTDETEQLSNWADIWYLYVSAVFLNSYLKTADKADFLPSNKQDFRMLLSSFLLEKAIYEVGYELNNRPDWLMIAVKGVRQILKEKI